jgi:hypothetical protein
VSGGQHAGPGARRDYRESLPPECRSCSITCSASSTISTLRRSGSPKPGGSSTAGPCTPARVRTTGVWQGLRNYLELLHVGDHLEAARNRLRLDRRANWRTTGASPFGIGLRGQIPAQCSTDFWLYDELGVRIWVHHDNEHASHRPLVFALELTAEQLQQRAPRPVAAHNAPRQNPLTIRHLRTSGPEPPHLPPYTGPPITHTKGPPHLHVQTGTGPLQAITEILTISAIRPDSHP